MTAERSVRIDAFARVEGEGGLEVDIDAGRVRAVRLKIDEPPRLFEAWLRGRDVDEVPDLTARICGICPVAYQMSSCQAIEAAFEVEVDANVRALRRLLYCGEWIESHALHIHLLHAPDFLGLPHAFAMATDHVAELERGLALKQLGNDIVELVGGRAVHPVTPCVGGFHGSPSSAAVAALAPRIATATEQAEAVARWVATFDFPDHRLDPETVLVALRHPTEYPMLGERMVATDGLDIGPEELLQHIDETQVAHSTALHGRYRHGGVHLVGPMARFALNADHLAPRAAALAAELGLHPTERNPFRSILVRAIETVHACETAAELVAGYAVPTRAAAPFVPRAAVGAGWSEAPRGVLWHRYEIGDDGRVVSARIVAPTSQNQPAIERDLVGLLDAAAHLDDDTIAALGARGVRNHDPCISCATHAWRAVVNRR